MFRDLCTQYLQKSSLWELFCVAFHQGLLYTTSNAMVTFDNTQQSKRIADIRNKEEEAFVERVAQKFGLPYIDLSGSNIETDALSTIPQKEAEEALIAPFKITGKDLYVGVKSPNLPQTKRALEKLAEKYTLGVNMVSTRSLQKAWARYADISHSTKTQEGMLDISPEKLEQLASSIKSNEDVARELETILADKSTKKTTQLMELIFAGAIATKSSDVHIEEQDEQVRLRFRQDGVLQDIANFDHESYRKLLSRIKLVSEMKLTQNENAQDGRFTIDYSGKEIEVRVSVIPNAYGESFVMRILNPDGINVGVEKLGIEPKLYEILMKEIRKPNGMILTTGPTGSGKTTTLYSFLNEVYSDEVKILTIEDPIEYHLKGISQTQVNRQKGYDFLSGLRAALRQDPDIVMVGEIRDGETASIAVNASLTGHLVLSTLHTNGAAGVIPRLIDLGVSPQILAAALSVSLAQRLVRKVCPDCKYTEAPNEIQETLIRDILEEAVRNNKPLEDYGINTSQKIMLTKGKGCTTCNGTGYKGRIGIFEAIITDEAIEELLNKKPSEQEVRRVAEKQGLLNMREDGVIKILNGITSFEEVAKVVDLEIRGITDTGEDQVQNSNNESVSENKSPEGVQSKKKDSEDSSVPDATESITKGNIPPSAVLSSKSIEISLLIDYLKKLEQEQIVNPETDISKNIKLVQKTILELLKDRQAEEILNQKKNFVQAHLKFTQMADELEELYQQQLKNPMADMSKKIRQLREEIEHHEVPTAA